MLYTNPVTAPAHTADPVLHPDPPQGPASALTRTARLLAVVSALIAFGKQLAATLQASADKAYGEIAVRFGTDNAALILARIARGLRLAEALEAKLAARAARPDPTRALRASSPPTTRKPRTKTTPRPDPDPFVLPSAEEIAEKLRTRPLYVVMHEICSDLGLAPADPLWDEINVVLRGAGFLARWKDAMKRLSPANFIPPNVRFVWPKPQPWQWPVPAAVAATGPP